MASDPLLSVEKSDESSFPFQKSEVSSSPFRSVRKCHPYYLGPLSVKKLPSDAWEDWCKDGVVCFDCTGPEVLKIYFGNPSDGSIYHVVDFVYTKYVPEIILNMTMISSILVGSRIYVLGGWDGWHSGPVKVWYCDVANQPIDDGGYQWIRGPDLNTFKISPFVFSLGDGSLYVLSINDDCHHYDPFEVLKPGSSEWQVLSFPPCMTLLSKRVVHGIFIDEKGKRIIVYVNRCGGYEFFYIYDVQSNDWSGVAKEDEEDEEGESPSPSPRVNTIVSTDFLSTSNFMISAFYDHSSVLDALGLEGVSDCLLLNQEVKDNHSISLHIFPLRETTTTTAPETTKCCFLALYFICEHHIRINDGKNRTYAQFGTFDLVQAQQHSSHDESSSAKRPRLLRYTVENLKLKERINLIEDDSGGYIIPLQNCSRV